MVGKVTMVHQGMRGKKKNMEKNPIDLSRNYVFYKKQYKRLGNPRKKHQKT